MLFNILLFTDKKNAFQTRIAAHLMPSLADWPRKDEGISYLAAVPYSHAIGSPMYAMIYTRPNIAYSVNIVSRNVKN